MISCNKLHATILILYSAKQKLTHKLKLNLCVNFIITRPKFGYKKPYAMRMEPNSLSDE